MGSLSMAAVTIVNPLRVFLDTQAVRGRGARLAGTDLVCACFFPAYCVCLLLCVLFCLVIFAAFLLVCFCTFSRL